MMPPVIPCNMLCHLPEDLLARIQNPAAKDLVQRIKAAQDISFWFLLHSPVTISDSFTFVLVAHVSASRFLYLCPRAHLGGWDWGCVFCLPFLRDFLMC